MDRKVYRVAGGAGTLLVLLGFLAGVLFQFSGAWLVLLLGAVLLAYAIYSGDRPFLREWTD